jgi:hypothetical protein
MHIVPLYKIPFLQPLNHVITIYYRTYCNREFCLYILFIIIFQQLLQLKSY